MPNYCGEGIRAMLNKRRRRKDGQIVKIDLGNQHYALAIVLREPLIAFFSKEFSEEEREANISNLPIAFTLMVMNSAVTSGRWEVVGNSEIPERLKYPPMFWKKDLISGQLSIYHEIASLAPYYERLARPEECKGLENAAVWGAENVEDRLRDYFAGRPNKWTESIF